MSCWIGRWWIVRAAGADVAGYEFAPVGGSTQAVVWRRISSLGVSADVALRLINELLERWRREQLPDAAGRRPVFVFAYGVPGKP